MNTNRINPGKISLLIVMAFFCSFSGMSQLTGSSLKQSSDTILNKPAAKFFLKNPSEWIQTRINELNSLTLPSQVPLDTVSIQKKIRTISFNGKLIKENIQDNSGFMRLRYILEYYHELLTDFEVLEKLQIDLQKQNSFLINKIGVTTDIEDEIEYFNTNAIPSVKEIYQREIGILNATVDKTSLDLSNRLMRLVKLEDSINTIALDIQETSKNARLLIEEKRVSLFKADYPVIWKISPGNYSQTFEATVRQTAAQSFESMSFFMNHGSLGQAIFRLLVLILVLLPLFYFQKENKTDPVNLKTNGYLHRYPGRVSLAAVLLAFPFMFLHAPFIFLDFVFILQIIIVSTIFISKFSDKSKKYFYLVLGFYFMLKILNLLVMPTFAGRIIVAMAIVMVVPMYILYHDFASRHNEKSKLVSLIFILLLVQISVGWIVSILGYYLLGRSYIVSGLDALGFALILYVTVNAAKEYLAMLTKMINRQLKSLYINGEIVEKYLGNLLVGLSVLLFLVVYLRNMNFYAFLSSAVTAWLDEPRQLGDSVFTYYNICLFIAFLAGSILLANFFNKIIDTYEDRKHFKKRTHLGGFMLLFRFGLITVGFVLAVIASGIPLTQVTVLMGALGVGIGFGLQNIFNNMVSGLIIAIEKPISVGDMIEVGTDFGWVRGIGIRSSNIQSFDGAEIIVPNGDIISNKVTNWTLSDKKRRLEIIIGVAYKSDPHQVYDLLIKILDEHPEILKTPEPFIAFTGLGESSLDFRICFWIADFIEGTRIKSDVLFLIFDRLKENNIEIPFPQRDLHLRSVDNDIIKKHLTDK